MDSSHCLIHQQAQRRADIIAVESDKQQLSYAQLNHAIAQCAGHLHAQGVRPSQRVMVKVEHNTLETIILFWALWRLGSIAVPISFRFPDSLLDTLINTLAPHWSVGIDNNAIPALNVQAPSDAVAFSAGAIESQQPVTMILTSGSTGTPKAAVHSYQNHLASAEGANAHLPLIEGDRWLLSLPLFHVGGVAILFRAALAGATITLPNERPLLAQIQQGNISHLSLVPTQLHQLIAQGIDLQSWSIKHLLLGGGPIPGALLAALSASHTACYTTYGLTEMGSQVTTSHPDETLSAPSSGRLLKYRELMINTDNEILCRGDTLFLGYWREGAIVPSVDSDGWFHTQDRGEISAGQLQVQGRSDNMFISGGENIQPETIEQLIYQQATVLQVIVVPQKDMQYGERPVAFMDINGEWSGTVETTQEQLRTHLPRFAHPIAYYPWPAHMPQGLKPSRPLFKRYANERLQDIAH